MSQPYQIKLDIFEGPLDLLLYLVTKDEVDIKDIQVSRVCQQFLEYLDLMKEINVDIAGEYLVMAATLIRLKARELLPQEETSELLENEEIISREQLIAQLAEYKKFKEAANDLKKRENIQLGTFYKAMPEKIEWEEEFEEKGVEAGIFDLLSAFKKILEQTPAETSHHVLFNNIKLDDRIEAVISYIADHPQAKFEELFGEHRSRMMVVVTFMAILELIKMEYIAIRQETQFGQIWVYKREPGEPVPAVEEKPVANETEKPETVTEENTNIEQGREDPQPGI